MSKIGEGPPLDEQSKALGAETKQGRSSRQFDNADEENQLGKAAARRRGHKNHTESDTTRHRERKLCQSSPCAARVDESVWYRNADPSDGGDEGPSRYVSLRYEL